MNPDQTFILTLDCDWAPDFILDEVREMLLRKGAHTTLFITHPSEALKNWEKEKIFELGWHPNFMPGSSQGENPSQVANYLNEIAPNAISMRTHNLMQSTPLIKDFLKYAPSILNDTSLYLPNQIHINSFQLHLGNNLSINRFPFCWEDDLHLLSGGDLDFPWLPFSTKGICILNFHPIHIYLNTNDFSVYHRIRVLGPMASLTEKQLSPFRNAHIGIGTLFSKALDSLDFSNTLGEFASKENDNS